MIRFCILTCANIYHIFYIVALTTIIFTTFIKCTATIATYIRFVHRRLAIARQKGYRNR
ncbi:MAG: hypothetical protein IK025_09235 [Bacteroidales bacterium]|nr:hypothetical protein [Bacteroidales bacterium]